MFVGASTFDYDNGTHEYWSETVGGGFNLCTREKGSDVVTQFPQLVHLFLDKENYVYGVEVPNQIIDGDNNLLIAFWIKDGPKFQSLAGMGIFLCPAVPFQRSTNFHKPLTRHSCL